MPYLRRLPKKGVIALTSPATTPDPIKLEAGVNYLESLGYRVEVGKTCTQKEHYLAGSDALRAHELNTFFADHTIDAIFCSRGGYGGMHLLDKLDYSTIRSSPKLFCGFSDITALQWAIYSKTEMPSVSGAMVATDFGDLPVDDQMETQFWELIDTGYTEITFNYSSQMEHVFEGKMIAGTLAVAAKQIGSPYFPVLENHIVVLEDVDEPMHKIEGYLRQFLLSGHFRNTTCVILGEFSPPKQETFDDVPSLEEIAKRVLTEHGVPFATGLTYGHIKNKISLPVGSPISVSLGPVSNLRSTGSLYSF
jgi:muramoyltetrapeptide carboxypeptidase